jgi:hypothetical protein
MHRYGDEVTYVTRSGKTLTDDEVYTRIKVSVSVPVSVQYRTKESDRIISRLEIDD